MDRKTGEKRIYVIGHRNPDADSVVSAAAYAALKQAKGVKNCVPARVGKPTPQTEYIFNRFKVPLPEFLSDLIPKVAYYFNPRIRSVSTTISLHEAMEVLEQNALRVLPVVDDEGKYHSLLHYSSFAQKVLKMINPQQKTVIPTSIDLLTSVLHTQALTVFNEYAVHKSPIIIAASDVASFQEHLHAHTTENSIVITGDRQDIQRISIESGVRAMIITNGNVLDRELRVLAEEKGVSVLISPYDTASTSLLIIYSMPVTCMSNTEVQPVKISDTVRRVAPLLSVAPGKTLPVVTDDGILLGVISESDLYREPNTEVILVDHNEASQAVEGLENFKILEIIDHHRLGTISTRYPITFINKPVGATSTIITNLYQEQHIPIQRDIAAILLCGILADTLVLQSSTTTQEDFVAAEYLSNITNLEIDVLGRELLTAASSITGRTAHDLIQQDMKDYNEEGVSFTVSQIEVEDPHEFLTRKDEFIAELEKTRNRGGQLFSALMVTDITELSSLLLIAADYVFLQSISLPRQEDSVFILRNVVSRKKQLMPLLSEILESYNHS